MTSEPMVALLHLLHGSEVTEPLGAVPPQVCARVLEVSGMAVSVMPAPFGSEVLWRSDEVSTALEDLQFTLGQGPSVDAAASGDVVLEPDLDRLLGRWPLFVPAAAELGVAAVFAFPLRVGAIRLGVLLAHRRTPGPMSAAVVGDALAFAEAVTGVLLRPATGDASGLPAWLASRPQGGRAVVHQATGMISVQMGVDLGEALVRLRAYAYGQSRPVAEVAGDVVARRLRFDERLL